jgi:tetratricopeptide (TPR) repeat protein
LAGPRSARPTTTSRFCRIWAQGQAARRRRLVVGDVENAGRPLCERNKLARSLTSVPATASTISPVRKVCSDHPGVATALNNLALLYQAQGRYADAEPLHKRALAIGEKTLGPDHPDVAVSLDSLAELYRAQGRYADAEIEQTQKLLADDEALVAVDLDESTYRAQYRFSKAL